MVHENNKMKPLGGYVVDCTSFNAYVKNYIHEYKLGNKGISDCHWVPQWEYAKKSEM